MASIGDLIMRVVADLKGFATTVEKEGAKAGTKAGQAASRNIGKELSKSGQIKTGLLQGLGIGAGLGVASLVTTVIRELTAVVGDSIRAFNEDQVSQQKLRTSLEANVRSWDGNTAAIEGVLASRMKLGFSDDEQRESLAQLVVATNDVSKALEIQRAAMDLARLKGISLAEAGQALIKIEGGQFRALKAMGIQLKQGATAQDALTAVQKAATGQAEDYAETNDGKVLVSQVKVNDAMERLGEVLAGPVADGSVAAADAIVGLFDALGKVGAKAEEVLGGDLGQVFADIGRNPNTDEAVTELGKLDQAITDFLDDFVDFATPWDDYVKQSDERAQAIRAESESLDDAMLRANHGVVSSTDGMRAGFRTLIPAAKDASYKVAQSFDKMVDDLIGDANRLISDFFDPIHARQDRFDARQALSAAIVEAGQARTKEAHRDAKRAILQALQDEIDANQRLGDKSELTVEKVKQLRRDATRAYKALGRDVPAELQKIIDKQLEIARLRNIKITVSNQITGGGSGANARAAGGRVMAGVEYRTNEYGQEFFRPDTGGTVIPAGRSVQATGGARSGDTYNFTPLPVPTRSMADIRREAIRISDVKRLREAR